MCIACDELSKVYDDSQKLMVSKFHNSKTNRPNFLLVQGNKEPQSVTIEVSYCPWCGKYLRSQED